MEIASVGIREAKMHLSRFLQIVKNGGEVILTDRGKPVGKIVPFRQAERSLPERLVQLEGRGIIAPMAARGRMRLPAPIPAPDGIAQAFLREDRRHGR